MTSLDESDKTSGILLVNTLDLNSQFDLEISNISISNSSTSLVSFGSIINTAPSVKHISIHNFAYNDSYIETERNLISTEGIEIEGNLVITLSQITFHQVSFYTTGNLISFGHQLPNYVEVIGLVMTNITAGGLHIESTNKQLTDILTLVHIQDSTFDNIDDQYSSLIITGQGGKLNVTNSSFTNIYTYEEGAVVFAGKTTTEVNFHDVILINNSAVTGALFHVESESVVR